MSKKPIPPTISSIPVHSRWRWAISCLILFHFAAIGLTYAANWRRSVIQDNVLVWLQPYLIGGCWYQEMLPIEWVSGQNKSLPTKVSIQTKKKPDEWYPVLDSRSEGYASNGMNPVKSRRLLRAMIELSANEETEGILRIFKSIVVHVESTGPNESPILVERIRLEQPIEEKGEDSDPQSDTREFALVEASVARFENGEIGLVPKIESHRSVRAKNAGRGNP
ncbi:MAG: hypothetical protein K9M08_01650 [Pirellula sp.]|nr:hypothetical protein [Pirellula sp.]